MERLQKEKERKKEKFYKGLVLKLKAVWKTRRSKVIIRRENTNLKRDSRCEDSKGGRGQASGTEV